MHRTDFMQNFTIHNLKELLRTYENTKKGTARTENWLCLSLVARECAKIHYHKTYNRISKKARQIINML